MKWEKLKPPEPDDPMCCCDCDVTQYVCCDCEDLDEACNRWLKGDAQNPTFQLPLLGPVVSKLWLPLLSDSRHLEISTLPALVLLPVLLRVAALHYLLGLVVLTALPGLVLWYYYATHRRKRRTLFFLSLALYSLAYMYYLFIVEILPRGHVSRLQLSTVTAGALLTLISLIHTKKGPGFVKAPQADPQRPVTNHSQEDNKGPAYRSGASQSELSTSTPLRTGSLSGRWTRCPVCKVSRPPRAGHCRTCGSCVLRLDHHCIWINSCVGQANHRSFILTLLVFLVTSLYGISLVLNSVCPRQYLMTALFYCPGVYNQYSTALCFTCAWYSSIVTGGLLNLFILQLINISYNVTEREAQLALRNKTCQTHFYGLVVDTGLYSRGFYHNWVEFLVMGDGFSASPCSLRDLV